MHNFLFPLKNRIIFLFLPTQRHTTVFVTLEPSPECQEKYFIRNAKANTHCFKQMWLIIFSFLLFSEVVRITAQFKMQLQIWQPASFLSEFDPESFMLFFWGNSSIFKYQNPTSPFSSCTYTFSP